MSDCPVLSHLLLLITSSQSSPILVGIHILVTLVNSANPTSFCISLSFDMQELDILRIFCIFQDLIKP